MKITVVGAVLVIAAGIAIVLLVRALNQSNPDATGGTDPNQP